MTVLSATAAHVTYARIGGSIAVYDGNTGNKIGQCDLIRGFAHYTGIKGSAHEGMNAVVRGGVDGLTAALAQGLKNGRNDAR